MRIKFLSPSLLTYSVNLSSFFSIETRVFILFLFSFIPFFIFEQFRFFSIADVYFLFFFIVLFFLFVLFMIYWVFTMSYSSLKIFTACNLSSLEDNE